MDSQLQEVVKGVYNAHQATLVRPTLIKTFHYPGRT
jgi:hypothetical protein